MPPGVKTVGASVNCVWKWVHLHGALGGSRCAARVWKGRTVLGPPPPPCAKMGALLAVFGAFSVRQRASHPESVCVWL